MRLVSSRLMGVLLGAAAFISVFAGASADAANDFRLKPGAITKVCTECHDEFAEILKRPYLHTPIKKGECAGCHNPHTSKHDMLLSAESGEICQSCHEEMFEGETKSVHQVFVEGKCSSCHDPHGAKNENNLVRSGSELCIECHRDLTERIATNEFEHDPVTDSCVECHNPHTSKKSVKLLVDAQPSLCLDCHEANDASFRQVHKNYPVQKARCTACHDPHGSNTAGLLFDNVHEPVGERACGECHAKPTSSSPFALKDVGLKLCEGCHYDLVVDALNKKTVHWPMLDDKGCVNCHAPHASPEDFLLKAPQREVCGRCHADTVARQARSLTPHPPVAEGACNECHSPHSSDNAFLAAEATTIEVCAKCHEWQTHSTHPIGENVVDPRNANVTVQCLSCHRTHGTEYEHFLYFETTDETCVQCHTNLRR
jgi:DmsE family decaheme c-type cytochrome